MKNRAEGDVIALFEEQQTLKVTWTSKRDKNDIAMGKSRSFSVCSASIDHSTCAPIGYPGLAGHEKNVVKSSLFFDSLLWQKVLLSCNRMATGMETAHFQRDHHCRCCSNSTFNSGACTVAKPYQQTHYSTVQHHQRSSYGEQPGHGPSPAVFPFVAYSPQDRLWVCTLQ